MSVLIGTGFWLLMGFIAYGLYQADALRHKIIAVLLLVILATGTLLIAYYYLRGDYLYHHGKVEQDCGVIIHPAKPLSLRQQRKSTTNRISIQSNTHNKRYQFRYIDDYYANRLSFNGLKKGDKVCFTYVMVDGFAYGYPYLLKRIDVKLN